ncbi:MAG: glycosyltransferase 87 family protein [Anaerolineales bacterium]
MKNINYSRLFILVALTSLAIVYAVIWTRMITDNAQRTGADFISFYAVGLISKINGYANAYAIPLQRDAQQAQVGFALEENQVLLYIHPPFTLPVLKAVVNENYVLSFYIWNTISLILYLAAFLSILQTILGSTTASISILAYWGGGLLFFPVFISLLQGQDTAILFLGAALWLAGMASKRPWLAGLGLGLTAIRPHMALLLTIPFAFRQQKIFLWAAGFASLLALFSLWLIGWQGVQQFVHILLISAGGEWFGMNEKDMFNLIGVFFRVFPQGEPGVLRSIAWGIYILSIGGLSFAWKKSPSIDNRLTGVAILLAVLASPHLHYHDLALLWFPLVFVGNGIGKNTGLMFVPAISLILLFSFFIPPLKFVIPYLVMGLCALFLIQPGEK